MNNLNIHQIWCGTKNIPNSINGANIITYPECDNPLKVSDLERFHLGSLIPNLIYADFDVVPKEGFFEYFKTIKPGKPHLVYWRDTPDCFLFAVNGNCSFFELIYNQLLHKEYYYAWVRKLIRYKDVERIPAEIYEHKWTANIIKES